MQSKKSFFNWTIFKKNIGKTWLISAGALFVMFLILGKGIFLNLPNYGAADFKPELFGNIKSMIELSWDFAFILPAAVSLTIFSYLQSARSVSFFHSLPVSRKGLFITDIVSGLLVVYIPNILMYIIMLVKTVDIGFCPLPELSKWLLIICAEEFLYYAIDVFCIILTGNLLISAGLLCTVMFLPKYVYIFLNNIILALTFGYNDCVAEDVLQKYTFQYVFDGIRIDLYNMMDSEGNIRSDMVFSRLGLILMITFVAAVIIYIAAVLVYEKRTSEASGDFIAVKWFKPVALWGGCVVLSSFISSLIVDGIKDDIIEKYTIAMKISSVVCFVVTGAVFYILIQLFINKSLSGLKKHMKGFLLFCGFMAVFGMALLGFSEYLENYRPDIDSVDYSMLTYNGKCVSVSEREYIEKHFDIQEKAVLGKDNWLKHHFDKGSDCFTIEYMLKDGTCINRWYGLSAVYGVGEQIDDYLDNNLVGLLYGSGDYNELIVSPAVNFETEYQIGIQIYDDIEAAKSLYNAISEDAEAGRLSFRMAANGEAELPCEEDSTLFYIMGFKLKNGKEHYMDNVEENVKIYFTEACTSTMNVFKELTEEYGFRE